MMINQGGKGIHSTQSSDFYGLLIHVLLHTKWKSQEKQSESNILKPIHGVIRPADIGFHISASLNRLKAAF